MAAGNVGNVAYTHLAEKQLAIYERDGIWQARIYVEREYFFRSLKTRDKAQAITEAYKVLGAILAKIENKLPIKNRATAKVIEEYVDFKGAELDRKVTLGTLSARDAKINKGKFKRNGDYWIEYCGKIDIEKIDNKILSDYPAFRNAYWGTVVASGKKMPKNSTLIPSDKTLSIEVIYMKSVLKWAQDRGYRGNKPHPTYTYKIERVLARTPFNESDFEALLATLGERGAYIPGLTDPPSYTRQLLLHYVGILRFTGMRVGEANDLKAADVQKRRDKDGSTFYALTVRGKTGPRELVARDRCKNLIEGMMKLRTEAAASDYFFPMKGGTQITTLADQLNDALVAAGVKFNASKEAHSLYSLRHNYALDMLNQNVAINQVAANMGTGVETIRKYYASRAKPSDYAKALRQ